MVTGQPGPNRWRSDSVNSSSVGGLSLLFAGSGDEGSSGLLTGYLLFEVIGLAEEGIPQDSGDRGIACVKALADTPLGVVGEVLCVVAPPGAVIVPQVVERVVRGPDREDRLIKDRCAPMDSIRCAHVGVMCGLSHQEPGQ